MRMNLFSWHLRFTLASLALTGFAMLSAAPRAHADDCKKQTEKAVKDWHKAVQHEGTKSDAAKYAKHEVRNAQQACWDTQRRWWDPEEHRWHTDKDFDDIHLDQADNH